MYTCSDCKVNPKSFCKKAKHAACSRTPVNDCPHFELAKVPSWKEVYQLPLHIDKHGSYAWSKNGTMALTFETGEGEKQFVKAMKRADKILRCINGENVHVSDISWHLKNECEVYLGDEWVFTVRGWGHLTGIGGLHLNADQACEVQDGFIKYILERLNSC